MSEDNNNAKVMEGFPEDRKHEQGRNEQGKFERNIRREFKTLSIVPSVTLRSKSKRNINNLIFDRWDKIRREDSRFDQSQYEGGREKLYQK